MLEASNDQEVLEALEKEEDIDLVPLDAVLPRKGSGEIHREIQRLRPRLPMVFMSGYDEEMMPTGFVMKSGHRFLQKPFGKDVLLRTLREVLDGRG